MLPFNQLDAISSFVSLIFCFAVYSVGVVVYRLTLHPLAKIPGPKVAAATWLYQTYWSYHNGESRFYVKIEELHKEYGSVVRITPDEISLSEPSNYEKIYAVGSKYSKDPLFYDAFGTPEAAFNTASNELHRIRRGALNPMFSRKSVLELEDVVQDKVQKLCQRLEDGLKHGKAVDLHHGLMCVSADVISGYAFDQCYDLLLKDDFGVGFFEMLKSVVVSAFAFRQWPILQTILLNLPSWMLPPGPIKEFNKFIEITKENVSIVKARVDAGEKPTRPSIFHYLMDPDIVKGRKVPNIDRLVDDALVLVAAGTETTGHTMKIIMFHVLSNPIIHDRLQEELHIALPSPQSKLDFVTLEKLPYLTAVIKEGLRLAFAVASRLPRVVPEPGSVFDGYSIQAGCVVSMSSWVVHHNEVIFPNSSTFDPSRWLDPRNAQYLEKYLVAFGKGSRQCVGMNLAYCELYLTLSAIFRRFGDLKVHGMTADDLVLDDYFGTYHPENRPKFHVVRS